MRNAVLALLAGLCAACAAAPPPRPPAAARGLDDEADRCPLLPSECSDGFHMDDDGCPDPPAPVLAFARGSAEPSADAAPIVAAVARELRRFRRDARVRVEGDSLPDEPPGLALRRAEAVRDALVRAGAPGDRVRAAVAGADRSARAGATPRAAVALVAEGCGGA